MLLKYAPVFVFFSFLLTSCIDDEVPNSNLEFADVEMVVKGKYGVDPLIKNRTYSYNEGSSIRFSEFNFFVSDLTTSVDVDETFSLDEVEYIDLALFEGEEAALNGFMVKIGRAPTGEYKGFSFGIGLNPELNDTKPDDYGQNHPLANLERYDVNLNGYKFLTIAGEVDYNSDNVYDENFNFAIAFNENYRFISSTRTFEIIPEVNNIIEVELDLRQILDNGIRSIDFMEQLNTSANPSDEIMLLLNSNIASAITVN